MASKRLKYSCFAMFFYGVFVSSIATIHLGPLMVSTISGLGILIAAWKLLQLNKKERENDVQRKRGIPD